MTIAGMMLIVATASIAVMAFRESTPVWSSLLFTLVLTALMAAVVTALIARGGRRAFAAGASVFGWVALALSIGPLSLTRTDAPGVVFVLLAEPIFSRLKPPTAVSSEVRLWRGPSDVAVWDARTGQRIRALYSQAGTSAAPIAPYLLSFQQSFASVGSLCFAIIGGLWANREYRKRSWPSGIKV